MKHLLPIIGMILVGCATAPRTISTVETTRLFQNPQTVSRLNETYVAPFELISAKSALDGGAVVFLLMDGLQQGFHFCEDRSLESKTYGSLYFGKRTDDSSKIVRREKAEYLLLSVLKIAFDSFYSDEDIESFNSKSLEQYTEDDLTYLTAKRYLEEKLR